MTLEQRLSALITAIGADIKALFSRSLPAGGTAGQVLAKNSSTNYDASWVTPSGGSGGESIVMLASDVSNANAVANTLADVTGLSFPVVAGNTYRFRFLIPYTAAATTTGSRWSINGPANSLLAYNSRYTLTATSETSNYGSAYNAPSASNASSLTSGNLAIIEGVITATANGNVVARFASEVANSAIVAKAGAHVQYRQVNT